MTKNKSLKSKIKKVIEKPCEKEEKPCKAEQQYLKILSKLDQIIEEVKEPKLT